MNRQYPRKLHLEKGMATLVIILLLLFVATLVTLYTASSTIREQQVSANQYRADQALSAANAGLDYGLAYYTENAGPDANNDGAVDILAIPAPLLTDPDSGKIVTSTVTFTDSDSAVDRNGDLDFNNDAADRPHTLTSTGWSDDESATRIISIEVDIFGLSPGGGLPGFPLVAKGIAGSGGNFAIINRFSHATIWTGADASALGSAETYVLNPLDPPLTRAEYIDFTGSPDPTKVLHASYSKAGLNSDVIENDDNLKNMTNDEFFASFMIENKPTIRSFADGIGQRFDADSISWSDLEVVDDGIKGLVWIDGDWSESGSMNTIGSEQYPISLIINGDFTTTGTGTPGLDAIGLIYVIGDWDSGGNFEVQGGVIVEGNVDNKGTPTIVYDNNLYDGSLGNPPGSIAALMSGTWKDW